MPYPLTDDHLTRETIDWPAPRPPRDALGLADLLGPDDRCPCGWEGHAEVGHGRAHLRWARGLTLPPAAWLAAVCRPAGPDPLLVIPQSAPAPLRRLAYDVGLLFRRENRYDFPPLPWPGRGGARWKDEPVAYLAVRRDRAIGLVVLHTAPCWGYLERTDAGGRVRLDQPGPVRSVAAVFVCGNYRRRGVAGRLVRAACGAEGIPLEDLAWGLPFTDAGAALAASLVPPALLRASA